jgi:hypothetical protein
MAEDTKAMHHKHLGVLSPEEFRELVAEHAYHKAEKRGFVAGHEMEDWLEAENEVRNQCFYWSQEVE